MSPFDDMFVQPLSFFISDWSPNVNKTGTGGGNNHQR